MNKSIFQGNWNQAKGKIKSLWGKLTDDDLTKIEGDQQQLFGILQKHYGYTNEEIEQKIKEHFKG